MTTPQLLLTARRVASAKNHLLEATMGDYSVASINRAEAAVAAAKAEMATHGLTDEAQYLDVDHGIWKVNQTALLLYARTVYAAAQRLADERRQAWEELEVAFAARS